MAASLTAMLLAASRRLALGLCMASLATPALADPCRAIPDRGALPSGLARGATFAGPVTYVGDGDSLCVAVPGSGAVDDPRRWVEVRLADWYAPESHEAGGPAAKAALTRLAKGRRAVCRADHRSYDRIVAVCRLGGRSLGDLMRAQGLKEGGRGRSWSEQARRR